MPLRSIVFAPLSQIPQPADKRSRVVAQIVIHSLSSIISTAIRRQTLRQFSNQRENLDLAGVPKPTWPLGSLHEADWSYIRREGNVREELYRLRDDAKEERNLAADQAAQPTLERMRQNLGRITAGPLIPERFSP